MSRYVEEPSWKHLSWSFVLAFLACYAQFTPIDAAVADAIYAVGDRTWPFESDSGWGSALHNASVVWSRSLLAALAVFALACSLVSSLRAYRSRVCRLLLSVLAITAILLALEYSIAASCPRDMARYGAALYLQISESCRPVGHGDEIYAWLAAAFLVRTRVTRALVLSVLGGLGILLGSIQQFRGSQFLSHELWMAAISWTVAVSLAVLWRIRR